MNNCGKKKTEKPIDPGTL